MVTSSGFLCAEPLEVTNALSLSTNVSAYTGVEFTLLCKEGFSASPDHGTMLCDDNGQWQNKAVCES